MERYKIVVTALCLAVHVFSNQTNAQSLLNQDEAYDSLNSIVSIFAESILGKVDHKLQDFMDHNRAASRQSTKTNLIDMSRLDLEEKDAKKKGVLAKLNDVADVVFQPNSYRDRKRQDLGRFSAEGFKEMQQRKDEAKEQRRIKQLAKELEEHKKYNKYLIKKHGPEGAKNLTEKGLINIAEVMDHMDLQKVHELQ